MPYQCHNAYLLSDHQEGTEKPVRKHAGQEKRDCWFVSLYTGFHDAVIVLTHPAQRGTDTNFRHFHIIALHKKTDFQNPKESIAMH